MCGRYVLKANTQKLAETFQADAGGLPSEIEAYNVAPGSFMPIVTLSSNGQHQHGRNQVPRTPTQSNPHDRTLTLSRWGLVPYWAKDEKRAYSMINARSESLVEKPSFREAFYQRRCIVPANGFYEWKATGGTGRKTADANTGKQPYYIHPYSDSWMAMAGLYERWRSPDGTTLQTFTIITTPATSQLEPLHDRMPALLTPAEVEIWMDPLAKEPDRLLKVLHPFRAESLLIDAVSKEVNNSRNQGAHLIQPSTLF